LGWKKREVFMRQTSRALFLAALVAFATSAVSRAQTPLPCGFWIAGELGYGSVSLGSDVGSRSKGGLAMGLEGGYEFPLWKRLHLAPVVDLAWGKLNDVDNALATIRNRRCKVFTFGISLQFS
jgi:hypothetical protein